MSVRAFLAFLAVCAVIGLLAFGLLSKGEAKIAVGDPVPDTELPVLGDEAKQGSIADYRGRWVLVNLWASWCIPCRQEAPVLDRFARQYRKRAGVLGINVQDNSDDALAFVREYDIRYRHLPSIGDERSAAFGSTGVPENVLVVPRGRLALLWRGPVDQSVLEKQVVPIVEGQE
jgi:cytochrome c biogenesis protein CcmG/thiol:disulfide interchange protein DsbE